MTLIYDSTFQCRPATFQVLNCHLWLVATILDSGEQISPLYCKLFQSVRHSRVILRIQYNPATKTEYRQQNTLKKSLAQSHKKIFKENGNKIFVN